MAGTESTISSFTCWRLVVDADFRTCLPGAGKYPERWFGFGEMGESSTEEASVVAEPIVDARDLDVEALWSESSAEEWLEAVDEETCLLFAISGAL
jgi:hypothetical protein